MLYTFYIKTIAMKKIVLALLLSLPFAGYSQNYQCLQAGVKHYFINGNGYLRGIRIDSVRTMGDTTVYYPFHTPRGAYNPGGIVSSTTLDSSGGSWLGKRVLQKNDGTFLFDSYWNDSVIIKTKANPGDTWVFYQDTSTLYYEATMLSGDTMTVLGTLDSIKTIMITAKNPAGIVSSDPLDSFNIILSKNNGFIQIFDLYTFPYHKPDSTYRPGLDFFLDRSTLNYNSINTFGGLPPATNITRFSLVDFINPNDQQLHNWNVGDIIESYHEVLAYPSYSDYTDYILDTVINKIVSGRSVNYTLSGVHYSCPYRTDLCLYYDDPCALILNDGTYIFYDTVYSIADTTLIPEENTHISNYVFYFPYDTSQCSLSPAYAVEYIDYSLYGEGPAPVFYKLGIGETHNAYFDDDCILSFLNGLTYTNINAISCGTLHTVKVDNIEIQPRCQIFPNPATEELTIKTTLTQPYTITLRNMLGEAVQTLRGAGQQQTLNVVALPAGVYNVSITDDAGSRYNEKVVVIPMR